MVNLLQHATSAHEWRLDSDFGGKTGTTNDYVDGWYMGITPGLVVGTWVGGEDRWIRFRSLAYGQGARLAKPFFREFVRNAQADERINWNTRKDFYKPRGELGIELDCDKYFSNGDILDEDGENIPQDSIQISSGLQGGFGNPDFE